MDLVLVTDIHRHLEEFPDNISKAWYDEKGLHMHDEFVQGHTEKVIVYKDRAGPARILKLIDKYPDYRVNHI